MLFTHLLTQPLGEPDLPQQLHVLSILESAAYSIGP